MHFFQPPEGNSILYGMRAPRPTKEHCTVEAWQNAGMLDADVFDAELAYFRQCYYADGAFTYHFDHLHFRSPTERPWCAP